MIALDDEQAFVFHRGNCERPFASNRKHEEVAVAAIAYPGVKCLGPGARPALRLVHPQVRSPRLPSPGVVRRRRQLAAVLLGLLLAVAVGWAIGRLGTERPLAGAGSASAHPLLPPVAAQAYVVQPGDTLWSITRAFHPDGDIRPMVARLLASRHGRPLQAGEQIDLSPP